MKDIDKAKLVLPNVDWSICGVRGRPFRESDLQDLQNLGFGDNFFAWERIAQGADYYTHLLRFRLSHYQKYGFGVQGLWCGNELIGQFGLQVLDFELDRVEFAVFLGERWKYRGLGTCLCTYLVSRCREVDMKRIFGAVRVDNPDGLALVERMNGVSVGLVEHFEQKAELFRIVVSKGS